MPNLTKDVGFLASFWPLYEYTYTGEVVEEEVADDVGGTVNEPIVSDIQVNQDDSDSNESGKSAFEFVEKSKDV